MTQTVNCKTCNKEIIFVYDPSDTGTGDLGTIRQWEGAREKKTVKAYLTCEDNHTHPYDVEVGS